EESYRHDLALPAAGFLLRRGINQAMVQKIIRTAARIAGDPEVTDRVTAARTTAERLARGEKVTGGPTLTNLLGDAVGRTLEQWLGDEGGGGEAPGNRSFRSFSSWPKQIAPEAYHGIAGEIVRTIEPHSEADPVALLVQTLVAFGSVIGRNAHIVVEADTHHMNLFAAHVGATSKGRKGTSWGQVRRVFPPVDHDWAPDRNLSGLSSGEGLIWAVRDSIKGREKVKEKGKPTRYEEVVVDTGEGDKRVLVVEPEFASVLRVMERQGNTLSSVIRQAWDTGMLPTMVKNSPARATDAHISIIAHGTRDELRRYLTRTEAGNGFANRLLWLCTKRSKTLPRGGNLRQADLVDLTKKLSGAVNFARTVQEKEIKFSESTWNIWEAVYPALSEGKPGLLGAVISRAEAQVLRLACLYALLDRVDVVQPEHLHAALAVWDYAEQSARYIFGDALGDPVADELLRALRATPNGLTRTAIRDLFGRNLHSHEIDRALGLLLEDGLAYPSRPQTGERGRPEERWHANTGGTTKTTKTTEANGADRLWSFGSFSSYLDIAKRASARGPCR